MRPNNRQRPRGGGRNGGGGGGGGQHYQKQHTHNPNRQPNRNQLFDSSGPDVRVRGNAHQVFDKYQALAREAAASGDRILSEAYWQYAEHYFRMIQTMGGFGQRNNQGWGDEAAEGSAPQPGQGGPQQAQNGPAQGDGANLNSGNNAYPQQGERQERPDRNERPERNEERPERGERQDRNGRAPDTAAPEAEAEVEPGLGGVAFLQGGRSAPVESDPAADEQPDIPEFTPPPRGRRSP